MATINIRSLLSDISHFAMLSAICGGTFGMTVPAHAQAVEASNEGVQEIVVTANRREQNLQDVPIAVTAVSADAALARGITGTASLMAAAPGLEVSKSGNTALIFLRGIGSADGNPNVEPSVAMYVDNVYMPAGNGNFFNYNNIERVEVLKGPQGTLFGRNATGGVVHIITADPSFEPSLKASVGYANYETISGEFYGTTGLNDKVAINFAAQGSHQGEGWGRNLTLGVDTFKSRDYSFRSKILLQPSEATKIVLSGNYNWIRTPAVSGQPAPGGDATINGRPFPGRHNVYSDVADFSRIKTGGASLRIDHDADVVRLVSISAYNKLTGGFVLDQDLSDLPVVLAILDQRNTMYSQEFQIANGERSSFDWLVGTYYFNYKAGYDPLAIRSGLDPNSNLNFIAGQKSESFAVFGQATLPITSTTNVTGGLRYTTEDQKYTGSLTTPANITFLGPIIRKQNLEKVTWRLSIDQKVTPDIMLYASLNRGFKSGGFNLVTVPGTSEPFKPEVLDAYEVGFKSTLADRRIRLNGAAYYYNYKNIQFAQTSPGKSETVNGPKATVYGFELDAQWAVSQSFNINVSGAYTHSRFGDFPNGPRFDKIGPNGIVPAQCVGAGSPAVPGTNCLVLGANDKGNELPFAPQWTYNIGADYTVPLWSGNLILAGSVYYNDGSFASPDNRLHNPSYYNVNASITWRSANERFEAMVWGRNLANEYYYAQAIEQNAPFGDAISGAPPRTYGIKLTMKY